MSLPAWLPAQHDPASPSLEADAWATFQAQFAPSPPTPQASTPWHEPASPSQTVAAKALTLERNPHPGNALREYTFWHVVTEGKPETARTTPKPERLVLLPWLRPLLDNHTAAPVLRWKKKQFGLDYYCVLCPSANYLVILKEGSAGIILTTAYPLNPGALPKKISEHAMAKTAGLTF
jgi:hypothetical protein